MSIFLVNPFVLSPIQALVRNYFSSGYNAGRTTTTATAFTSRSTVSTTEIASTNYVAFWQGTSDGSSTTSDVRAQLVETSVRQLSNIEPQDATDAFAVGGMYPYAGGTNKTFTNQFSAEAAGTSVGYAGTEVNVLQLHASDKFAYTSGSTTATANAASVTITEAGEYLVIGSGMVSAGGNAGLFDGTVTFGAVGVAMAQDATTFTPFWHFEILTLTASQVVSVRVTTGSIRQAAIVALKTDKFENVYSASLATQQTTTSTTPVTAFSGSFTIANPQNYHLILGCGQLQSNSTTLSAACQLQNITRNINYNVLHFRENNATTEWYPTPVARIANFASNNPEIGWRLQVESGATARIRNMNIALVDLGILGPPIAFVGGDSIINSTSITIPTLVEAGDIVIVASHSTSTAQNLPTGYTNGQNGTTGTVNYRWSYKFMGATPDATVTGLTATADTKHIVMVFRDVNSVTPIANNPPINSGLSALPDPPDVTVTLTSNPQIVVTILFLDDDNVQADITPPSNYTTAATAQATGTIAGAYRRFSEGGTADGVVGIWGIGAGSDDWVCASFVLNQV